jgi:hypothetical protein
VNLVHTTLRTVSVFLTMCLVAGCASQGSSPGDTPETAERSTSSAPPDPALTAAAQTVEPALSTSFSDAYAGLVLNHENSTLIVYRRPDPRLDAFVKQKVTGVRVVFRDASYSLRQMQDLAARVMNDADYWRSRGTVVNGAGPLPDGSGIEVMTANGTPEEQRAFNERYNAGSVRVLRGSAIPPIATTPWRPSPSPPASNK